MREERSTVGVEQFGTFVDGLDYPVYVVTTVYDGERSGCLVGFTTQVSIDPPLMLVCISDKNHTHRLALQADLVAVHVLSPAQRTLSELFGEETGDRTDKFARSDWRRGPGGVPLLEGCPRHMVGRVTRRIPFGDHLGLLLEPLAVRVLDDDGCVLTLVQAEDLKPGHEA